MYKSEFSVDDLFMQRGYSGASKSPSTQYQVPDYHPTVGCSQGENRS